MEYPELRISFHPGDERNDRRYEVELHLTTPGTAIEDFFGPFPVEFDWDDPDSQAVALSSADKSDAYGQWLSASFFRDAGLKEKFVSALDRTAGAAGLRVRLCLTPATERLHGVLWERLQHPSSGTPLATSERILLSRFLSGGGSRVVRLRPRSRLRALVVIANPRGLSGQSVNQRALAPIDVEAEWSRAQASLASISAERLPAQQRRASLAGLMARLRDEGSEGGFDILYLVCHGALVGKEPLLWLEDENGAIDRVSGGELAQLLQAMVNPPRLVVLASCQSGGQGQDAHSDDRGELAALAPRLAEAGVPAVIAMQSDVRMNTAAVFFPTFFDELMKDGQIDRAVAVARAAIQACPDWWVPMLITRLRYGRIWSEHGGEGGFSGFDGVVSKLGEGRCTPIVGPDLVTAWTGSPIELAQRWAQRFEFPMAPTESESLPPVAQYLAYHKDNAFLRAQMSNYIREYLVRHFPSQLPPEGPEQRQPTRVVDLLTSIWAKNLEDMQGAAAGSGQEPNDPHWLLAGMPFPVYITTNRDELLTEALRRRGKKPRVEVCRWPLFEEDLAAGWPPSVFAENPRYRPSVEEPLVFHAFGRMLYPETLVLTEDDFFDYLIGITRNEQRVRTSETGETGKAAIPEVVTTALSWRSLLFLGFRISDWEFRTLFRRILAQEKSVFTSKSTRIKLRHVAVQLDPAPGGEYLEPEGARAYLMEYFGHRDVSVYWGSAKKFIEELHAAWRAAGSPEPGPDELEK